METSMQLVGEQRRCLICGQIAYGTIWLDDEPPNGRCPDGNVSPCAAAMQKARIASRLISDGITGPNAEKALPSFPSSAPP